MAVLKYTDKQGTEIILGNYGNSIVYNDMSEYLRIDDAEEIYVKKSDADKFATQENIDALKEEIKNEMPDLTGFATQTWVKEQQYLTQSNIANLATQDSVKEVENKIPSIWKGTADEYAEINPKDPNTLYLIKEE